MKVTVEEANRILTQSYPYGPNTPVDPRALKISCLAEGNGRHFAETETVTLEKLNQHCEMLREAKIGV